MSYKKEEQVAQFHLPFRMYSYISQSAMYNLILKNVTDGTRGWGCLPLNGRSLPVQTPGGEGWGMELLHHLKKKKQNSSTRVTILAQRAPRHL